MDKIKKSTPVFESEVALCAAFLETIDAKVWTAYPETAGWDILMVRNSDGFQIGVQAKLKLNIEVINQAIDGYAEWSWKKAGPDCRALLVPSSNGFAQICGYLALVVVTVVPAYMPRPGASKWRADPRLPSKPDSYEANQWPEWAPIKRHELPAYVPDLPAGASGPVQLTDWKIKAIKLAVLLENNGVVHRADFQHLKLDHRRWVEGKWLTLVKDKGFIAGPGMPNFKKQHPKVYVQIKADIEKWKEKGLT